MAFEIYTGEKMLTSNSSLMKPMPNKYLEPAGIAAAHIDVIFWGLTKLRCLWIDCFENVRVQPAEFNCPSLQTGLAQGVDPTLQVGRVFISISPDPAGPLQRKFGF